MTRHDPDRDGVLLHAGHVRARAQEAVNLTGLAGILIDRLRRPRDRAVGPAVGPVRPEADDLPVGRHRAHRDGPARAAPVAGRGPRRSSSRRRRRRHLPGGRLGADDRHHPQGRIGSLHGHQQRRDRLRRRARDGRRLVLMDCRQPDLDGLGRVSAFAVACSFYVIGSLLLARSTSAAARTSHAGRSTPSARAGCQPRRRRRLDGRVRAVARLSRATSPAGGSRAGRPRGTATGRWPTARPGSRAGSAAPRTRTGPGAGRSSAAASAG